MENIDKVLEALSVVERYEDYLFERAWGRALVVIGIIFPLGILINSNIEILATSSGLDPTLFILISNVVILVLCWALVMSIFFSAWRTVTKDPDLKGESAHHGVLIAIVWFLSFLLPNFVPDFYQVISILWASSIACILSYLILRFTGPHQQERIVLSLGLMLGLVSLPLVLLADNILAGYLALIAFSICFIMAGLMMHQLAHKTLQKSQ